MGGMSTPSPRMVPRLRPFASTIFAEMTQLAQRTGAVNLGQGFPDADGPEPVRRAAMDAIADGVNQYPPARGLPRLREAVAAHQRRLYGIELDPQTQVIATVGATEGIAASLMALCGPGDEVVTFEPAYDSYTAMVAMAGARHRSVPLHQPDFGFTTESLAAAFTDRTRVVLLNSPHNPTGKVFSRDELEQIARLAIEHDTIVVTDEVYEHLTYDGARHIPMATLPGMADRTLTISGVGKSFSLTGWKVGWVSGPAELVAAVLSAKQYLTFSGGGPFQAGAAVGLAGAEAFTASLRDELAGSRRLLLDGLTGLGWTAYAPDGTYFVVADAGPEHPDGVELCWQLPELCGVVAVPVAAFHDDPGPNRSLVRFAFCKDRALIERGLDGLAKLRLG